MSLNPIQRICLNLQGMPINGRLDNPPSIMLKEFFGDQADDVPFTGLITDDVTRIVLETCHDVDADFCQKQLLKHAKVYFTGVEDPLTLDLMPAHMAFPTFPKQLFSQANGTLTVIDNPYFKGDLDRVYKLTLLLYLAIERFAGYNGLEKKVKTVDVNLDSNTVSIIRTDALTPELIAQTESAIFDRFRGNKEAYITHFVINFMPDMLKKVKQSFEPVKTDDGREAMQNTFTAVDWSSEELTKDIDDLLGEISFAQVSDTCPAYIRHGERLTRYTRTILADALPFSMPLEADKHGMSCDSWDTFFTSSQGLDIIEMYEKALLNDLKSSGMTLGNLIHAYESIKPSSGGH